MRHNSQPRTHWIRHCIIYSAVFFLTFLLFPTVLHAIESQSPPWSLVLAGRTVASSELHFGDSEPVTRVTPGLSLDLDRRLGASWRGSLSTSASGSYFAFHGIATEGRATGLTLGARAGLDRLLLHTNDLAICIGVGANYVESRSWLATSTTHLSGPRNILTGGDVRMSSRIPGRGRMAFWSAFTMGVYRGNVPRNDLLDRYEWLGTSAAIDLGIAWSPAEPSRHP